MRVLVGCESSGVVRDAFRAAGHEAYSCDLLPCEKGPEFHMQTDLFAPRGPLASTWRGGLDGWDLAVFHPPCTDLAVSGARWMRAKGEARINAALYFVRRCMEANVPRIAVENPVSIISTRIRKPDQIVQPWMFGHGETKATCLWLKNLPPLKPTNIVDGREARVHKMPPGPERWKERSRTLPGLAAAMAEQWGSL